MGSKRDTLIGLCEQAAVREGKWRTGDTERAQRQVGECLILLRAGCKFTVGASGDTMNGKIVWVNIRSKGFRHFEWGGGYESHLFYLPTQRRLDTMAGEDWYV